VDFKWESLTAIGTLLLASATFVTVYLLWKEAKHQTKELENQTQQLKAQAKALTMSAEQFVTAEHLRMGRWLADHPWVQGAMTQAEDVDTVNGENGAALLSYFMDQILRQSRLMGLGNGEQWKPYFRDKLKEYPQVRRLINSHPDHFSEEDLRTLVKEVSDSAK